METDMTREEAIKVLEQIRQWTDYPKEALTMAIEALSKPERPSNLDEAAKKYRDFREECGIKDQVMLNEIEEAHYAGAEWMAKQGVSMEVVTGVPWRAVDAFIHDYDYTEDSIIQIRKK